MDVGSATFSTIKRISQVPNKSETVLVAKGKSYLSYFYVGVCSTVLYLSPEVSNDAVLFQENEGSQFHPTDTPIAMEIQYHKPARAVDFQWATNAFIEKNLRDKSISDLPLDMQRKLSQFNDLYRDVRIGDRYTLEYIPRVGVRLHLNEQLLGTVGVDMKMKEQRELARIIYSVWFGSDTPFSESMKKELLTPIQPPVETIPSPSLKDAQKSKAEIEAVTVDGGGMILSSGILSTSGTPNTSDELTEEERSLLESLGLLETVTEQSVPSPMPSRDPSSSTKKSVPAISTQTNLFDSSNTSNINQSSTLTRIRNFMFPNKNVSVQPEKNGLDRTMDETVLVARDSLPLPSSSATMAEANSEDQDGNQSKYNPILLGLGGAAFLLPHLAVLLSLPPVLRGRGAPYLPTFSRKQSVMFELVREHALNSQYFQQRQKQKSLQFVDLGSGDGRVVFRAAREGLFGKSVGYEINPTLHLFSSFRRLVTPRYWDSCNFFMRDLWKIQLHRYDVVAVYGLSPIMQRLGKKLEEELKPGSVVVSNVFEVPGWRASSIRDNVYLYRVPECFRGEEKNK